MKLNIPTLSICLSAIMSATMACTTDSPILTDRHLDTTDTWLNTPDAPGQNIYYKPRVGYVGDPMPFYDPVAGDFKIMYLQDFRPNQAATYHPIWAVATSDGAAYTSLGEMIACGSATELDAALGTGSTVYDNGTYYTFYTAHSANPAATAGINEAVMMATSTDFKQWTKHRSVIVSGGSDYSTANFRDPFVFKGDDNRFHMLVSTQRNGKGVLAEYVSDNLTDWTSAGVFMTMMWDRFYECPDVFKMGDWWYLIYSEQHDAVRRVQYFKARSLDELRNCTANDAAVWPDDHEGFMDSRGFYAGKTASNGTDRFIWGWCPTRAGASNLGTADWGGNLVAHRLIQHADGSLSLGEVPGIAALFGTDARTTADFGLTGNEFRLMPRLGTANRISFTVTATGATDRFGASLGRGSDSERFLSLIVNPEDETYRKINCEDEGGRGFIADTDGYRFRRPADNVYHITIVTDNSVVTMYVNDIAAITTRAYGAARNCWSINSYGGSISVTDIKTYVIK